MSGLFRIHQTLAIEVNIILLVLVLVEPYAVGLQLRFEPVLREVLRVSN